MLFCITMLEILWKSTPCYRLQQIIVIKSIKVLSLHLLLPQIQVQYDGNVTWLTQGIYTSKCDIDVQYYPMDSQNCSLKFASWSQEVTKVYIKSSCKNRNDKLQLLQLNLSVGTEITQKQILTLYTMNKEFELKEFFGVRHETPDPCCVAKFADVT